jgi:hypothetical protein
MAESVGVYWMSLQKLARELDETARQSASMLEGITEALDLLSESDASKDPSVRRAIKIRAPHGRPLHFVGR